MIKFPPVRKPVFKAEKFGHWEVEKVPPMSKNRVVQRGYHSRVRDEALYWMLKHNGKVWMTTSLLDMQSHAVHVKHAKGTVMVCGIGMGVFLYNIALKPEVDRIVAVDINYDIMEWCKERAKKWDGFDKIQWLVSDARTLQRPILTAHYGMVNGPDHLYVDIWPTLMDKRTMTDVTTIQRQVLARNVGWWGHELWFMLWCNQNSRSSEEINLDTWDEWCLDVDMNIYERSTEYLSYCGKVAKNQVDAEFKWK